MLEQREVKSSEQQQLFTYNVEGMLQIEPKASASIELRFFPRKKKVLIEEGLVEFLTNECDSKQTPEEFVDKLVSLMEVTLGLSLGDYIVATRITYASGLSQLITQGEIMSLMNKKAFLMNQRVIEERSGSNILSR